MSDQHQKHPNQSGTAPKPKEGDAPKPAPDTSHDPQNPGGKEQPSQGQPTEKSATDKPVEVKK